MLGPMRAVTIREHGEPEVLKLEDLPVPVPGRHELLVAVHATSLNPVDARVRRQPLGPRAFPIVLGYDASGVVAACGADAIGWNVGDQVFRCPNLFGQGANADYVLLDARARRSKPAILSITRRPRRCRSWR